MSELFEALKKIEKNKNNSKQDEVARAFSAAKRKPPYLLILSSILFVLFAVFCGFYTVRLYQARNSNQQLALHKHTNAVGSVSNYSHKKIEVKQSNKVVESPVIKNNKLVEKQQHKINTTTTATTNSLTNKNAAKRRQLVGARVKKIKVANNLKEKTKVLRKRGKEYKKEHITTAQLVQQANSSDFKQSMRAYELLLKRFPNNIALYNDYAAKLMENGSYKKASAILEKALEIEQDPDVKLNLVICYIKLGELNKAKELVKTIEQTPGNEQILNQIRIYLFSSGQ